MISELYDLNALTRLLIGEMDLVFPDFVFILEREESKDFIKINNANECVSDSQIYQSEVYYRITSNEETTRILVFPGSRSFAACENEDFVFLDTEENLRDLKELITAIKLLT